MDASVCVRILTLNDEVDARGWHPSLVGGDAAVPASIVCCNLLDLQRQVGGETRTCAQSKVQTTTLPGQVKAYGAGHHAGQHRTGAWWRCYIVRHGDVRWRLYTQTNNKKKNLSASEGFPRTVNFLSHFLPKYKKEKGNRLVDKYVRRDYSTETHKLAGRNVCYRSCTHDSCISKANLQSRQLLHFGQRFFSFSL